MEDKTRARAIERASIDSILSTDSIDQILDRILTANPKNTDPEDLAHARRVVYSYQTKYGRNERPQELYRPLAPDDVVCAQLCALLTPVEIDNFVMELRGDYPPPQPGHRYSWYVTVALQRRYGIAPSVLKERRARLRVERYRGKALSGEQAPLEGLAASAGADPAFADALIDEIKKRVGRLR